MLRLSVTDPSGKRTVESDRSELVIGRREGVDLRIEDGAASRNHCVLRLNGRRLQLIDLGSENGVVVGRKKVQQAMLAVGDAFRIGRTVIRVESIPGPLGLALEGEQRPPKRAAPATPVPTGAAPDFGREVRAMLSRAPWYMLSLMVHAAALLLLAQVPFSVQVESRYSPISASRATDIPEADEVEEYQPPEPERPPEVLDDRLDEPDEAGTPDEKQAVTEATDDPDSAQPNNMGTGEALTQRISPLSVRPKIKKAGRRVDTTDIDGEHGAAKRVVERGMGRGLRSMRALSDKSIVVIKGDFDKIELILDKYKIPHTFVDRDRFLRSSFPKAKVICANCARKPASPSIASKLARRVQKFVQRGGWFVSSDWSIDPYLTIGWPAHVTRMDRPKRRQSDTTITVEPAMQSPLLAGVFARKIQTRWWLEETSAFFRVSKRANVLIRSPDALERYGSQDVVLEFRSGRGRVMHILGHFWQEDGNRAGIVAMHMLIINILHERFRPPE